MVINFNSMECQKYFNSESFQKKVLIGVCLILVGAASALMLLLNWQFTTRIAQLENAALANNNRLANIESFLANYEQQLKTQKSQADLMDALSNMSAEPQQ